MSSDQPEDAFDAGIGQIGRVLYRQSTPRWGITDLANHRYDILAYAVEGKAHYTCGRQSFAATPGTLLFFPRGVVHSARSDPQDPWTFYSVMFELLPSGRDAANAFASLPAMARPGSEPQIEALFAELERAWASQETGYRLRCRGILLQLLHRLVIAGATPVRASLHARRILPVVERLKNDSTRAWTLGELAKLAGLSKSRFRTVFKQVTGTSTVRYINWLRINRARALLMEGDYTVTEAAERVGFSDVYYFSRLFRKMTGASPSSYRLNG